MDPITASAIISAITTGAISAVKDIAKKNVVDAYEALKKLIQKKYGEQSEVMQSVTNLENKPESKGWQMLLEENIVESKLDDDLEIRELVQKLLAELQQSAPSQHFEQHATGDGIIQIQDSGKVTINK